MKPRLRRAGRSHRPRSVCPDPEDRSSEFYQIARDGRSITCHACGFMSTDPKDVEAKYCPVCRLFHEDRMVMARLAEGYEARFEWEEADLARGPGT